MAKYRFSALKENYDKARQGQVRLHVSETNSKLGCIPSFNLLPGLTCSPEACRHCLREGCYAVKNLFCHGYNIEKNTTLRAWADNTVLATEYLERLEICIIDWLVKHHNITLFRIHSSGDFFSVEYANMWYSIAHMFPAIRFLAFTKQWDIVRQVPFYELPNFSLVLSGWTGISIPEDLREQYACAWCNDGEETRIPDDAMQCPGSCESCGLCWYLKEIGRDTVFTKH